MYEAIWKIEIGKHSRDRPEIKLMCNDGRQITIWYTRNGEVIGFPYSDDELPHFRYRIHFSDGKNTVNTLFYGSCADYEEGKNKLTVDDLIFAVNCTVDDAIQGSSTYEEFCAELGYDPKKIVSYKIYNACKRVLNKLMKVGLNIEDMYVIRAITTS